MKIEEIVEDEKQTENTVSEQSKKKNKSASKKVQSSSQQAVLKSSSSVPVLESEDEDGFPISSSASAKDSVPSGIKNTEMKKEADDSGKSAKRKRGDSVVGNDDLARYDFQW